MDDRRFVSLVDSEEAMMPLEQRAVSLCDFAVDMVPSLVQTGDYARAVAQSMDIPPERIERWVEARLMRQFLLTKDNPPRLEMFIYEDLLSRVVGDHQVMARQLRAILEAAERRNVKLRLVSSDRKLPVGLDFGFYVIAADSTRWVAYSESPTTITVAEDDEDVEPFLRRKSVLNKNAHGPVVSTVLVNSYAQEYECA
jgi:uncharacterized protein DUF5753